MNTIHLYFKTPPEHNRFLPGDKYIVPLLRRIIRRRKVSGVKKVFINLCKGFDSLAIKYTVNLPFYKIKPGEPVVVLGDGAYALEGYNKPNLIIAGIGLVTHPAEWPDLFREYPVAKYLQHSAWTRDIYIPYYGIDNCLIWPSGIDTDRWAPDGNAKQIDFLVYDKVMWPQRANDLVLKATAKLTAAGYTYKIIKYGDYQEAQYYSLLQQCRAMLFLCEHESQGFACCEALSMNVPVYAWDQGFWLDPNRFLWHTPVVKATSIPFFDSRCGLSFSGITEFEQNLPTFWTGVTEGKYNPRAYILETLTLKQSALSMLQIIDDVYANGE